LVKGARNLTEVDIGHRVCRWGVFLYQVKACAQSACGIGCTVVTGTKGVKRLFADRLQSPELRLSEGMNEGGDRYMGLERCDLKTGRSSSLFAHRPAINEGCWPVDKTWITPAGQPHAMGE